MEGFRKNFGRHSPCSNMNSTSCYEVTCIFIAHRHPANEAYPCMGITMSCLVDGVFKRKSIVVFLSLVRDYTEIEKLKQMMLNSCV